MRRASTIRCRSAGWCRFAACGGEARGRRWVAWKDEDPLVRAPVLLRPPGVALPDRARCEPHDLSQCVVLRTKLETHVLMKSHMNVICLQCRSLQLCLRSGLGASGRSERTLMSPRGGVNRRDDQIKLFLPKYLS
jgi:hypothetical protein